MMASDCQRWATLSDRLAVGEGVSDREQAWLAHHARGCAECAREAALYASLREAVGRPERLLVAAPVAGSRGRLLTVRRASVALLALAAGIALGFGLRPERGGVQLARPVASPAPLTARLLFASGEAQPGQTTAAAGRSVVHGERLATRDGRACLAIAGSITVCLDRHSTATVSLADPSRAVVQLERGRLLARLDRQPAGRSFAVRTPKAEVQAVGTRFSVTLAEDGQTQVRLHEGRVAVRAANRLSSDLVAPAQANVGDDIRVVPMVPNDDDLLAELSGAPGVQPAVAVPRVPEAPPRAPLARTSVRPSPAELLAKAQATRARGAYDACAQLYRRLWSEHPGSEEAKVSMVSLGELELGKRDRPAAALEAFTAYLQAGGPLEREARFGRIRALRALGRQAEAERDSAAFLRDYPTSVQATALRREP